MCHPSKMQLSSQLMDLVTSRARLGVWETEMISRLSSVYIFRIRSAFSIRLSLNILAFRTTVTSIRLWGSRLTAGPVTSILCGELFILSRTVHSSLISTTSFITKQTSHTNGRVEPLRREICFLRRLMSFSGHEEGQMILSKSGIVTSRVRPRPCTKKHSLTLSKVHKVGTD